MWEEAGAHREKREFNGTVRVAAEVVVGKEDCLGVLVGGGVREQGPGKRQT